MNKILPILPFVYQLDFTDHLVALSLLILAIAAITTAGVMGVCAAKKFNGHKKKTVLCFVGITVAVTVLLCCFFGLAAGTVKGLLLFFVLLYSSYEDLAIRECDDYLHLMIVSAALIDTKITELPTMLLSGIVVCGMMIIAMWVTKSKMGGADLKLASACAFLLGLQQGIWGLAIGLTLAVLTQWIRQKDKNVSFPLIPYLSTGFMAAYFI